MAKNSKERKLDAKLLKVYNEHGLKMFINVCSELLNVKDRDNWEKKMRVNGEVCECVLRVMTEHYLRERCLEGYIFHSLVLKNKRDPKSEFRTELDFTLMTPFFCATAECKSFSGQITVTDLCTLNRDKLVADVARQTDVHVRALVPYLEGFVREGAGISAPPLKAFCFLYSNGAVTDRRNPSARDVLPVQLLSTLYKYYDGLFRSFRREVYDVKAAAKTFQKMADSRVLHIQHANYVGY